jgi:hypothetical protein
MRREAPVTTESKSKRKENAAGSSPASSTDTKRSTGFVTTIKERTDPGGMVIVGFDGYKKSQS